MIWPWIGALLVGVTLGLLGAGGAILTVPVLVYLVGHEEKVAVAEALAIVAVVSLFAASRGIRRVQLRTAVYFAAAGIVGAYIGAWLSSGVTGAVQLFVLAVAMLAAAWFMARAKPTVPRPAAPQPSHPAHAPPAADPHPRASWPILLAQGGAVGVLTGFAGVGGGFLIVPALVILGGLPMSLAVPTSLTIIAINSTSGFLSQYYGALGPLRNDIRWDTVGLFMALGIVGSFAGAYVGGRIDQKLLRRIFAAFLVVLGAYILWRQAPGLF